MDINSDDNGQKPISDDQELAKALAGVTAEVDNMKFEETPAVKTEDKPAEELAPVVPAMPAPAMMNGPVSKEDLDKIKTAALTELRPLVDKLDLEPEDKFNTYLLLLRSTDDKTLLAPAHEAAKNIPDEARKAQALLDIIKEVDFLSSLN